MLPLVLEHHRVGVNLIRWVIQRASDDPLLPIHWRTLVQFSFGCAPVGIGAGLTSRHAKVVVEPIQDPSCDCDMETLRRIPVRATALKDAAKRLLLVTRETKDDWATRHAVTVIVMKPLTIRAANVTAANRRE